MLKRNGYSLTDEQVRAIKANMVQGVTLTALSRAYGTSVETLSRIRRGLTYQHVKVLGEETLRPEVKIVAPTATHLEVMSGVTDEAIEASQERLLAELARDVRKERAADEALTDFEKMAQSMLGNTPMRRSSI